MFIYIRIIRLFSPRFYLFLFEVLVQYVLRFIFCRIATEQQQKHNNDYDDDENDVDVNTVDYSIHKMSASIGQVCKLIMVVN